MRLQTRTWDQNGPKFILDAAYSSEGFYICELSFNSNVDWPVFIPVFLNEENYKTGKYFIKDELNQYILSNEEYQENVKYYEKTEIKWEISVLEKDGANVLFPDGKKFYGEFTIDNIPQGILQQFEVQFGSEAIQEDLLGFELRINWNGYTYANITRYEEVQRGIVNARLDKSDSLVWAPELYYNNDYIRMTDELNIYWNYFYDGKNTGNIILTLSEQPRKDALEEKEKTLGEWLEGLNQEVTGEVELVTLTLPKYNEVVNIQLSSLSIQPTPGADLYVTMYAQNEGKNSSKVKGIVAQLNQPPNQPQLALVNSNTTITDEQSISFRVSAENESKIVVGETEKIIAENGEIIDENLVNASIRVVEEKYRWEADSFTKLTTDNLYSYSIVILDSPIPKEYIENFTTLEITARSYGGAYHFCNFGLRKEEPGEKVYFDSFIPKKDEPNVAIDTSKNEDMTVMLDLTGLDNEKDWYLVSTTVQGYAITSIKLTGGTGTRILNFVSNDPDNTDFDFKNLSQNLWYSINNGPKTKIEGPFNDDAVQLNVTEEILRKYSITEPGSYSLSTYVYDGLEYSVPSSWNFNYYPLLGFQNEAITEDLIPTGVLDQQLTKKTRFSFELLNNITKLYPQIVIDGYDNEGLEKKITLPVEFYTFNFLEEKKWMEINIQNNLFLAQELNSTKGFKVSYRVSYYQDFEKYIEYTDSTKRYYPVIRTSTTIFPQDSSLVEIEGTGICSQENYFSNTLIISTFYPQSEIPYPAHDSMSACFYKANATSYFKEEKLEVVDGKWAKSITLKDWVDPSEQIGIDLVYKDILGNTITKPIDTKYTRASSPKFANEQITSNPFPLKPFTAADWKIIHSLAQAEGTTNLSGEDGQVIEGIKYSYEISLLGESKPIEVYDLSMNELYFQRELNFNGEDISEIFLNDRSLNEVVFANFIVTAEDSFGQTASISQKFEIDYRESPIWPDASFLTILHDYSVIKNIESDVDLTSLIQVENNKANTQMFNAGEGIVFKFPKPSDINGEGDITDFVFFLSREDLLDNSIPLFQEEKAKQWLTIPVSNLTESEGFYYYRYNASTYQKNECFYFMIMARDSTGLTSLPLNTSGLPIFGCRTAPPVFDQDTINIKTEEVSNGWKIYLTWKDFIIRDLGGSATSAGWNKDYYELYPNLEREIANYEKNIYFLIEISPSPDFSNTNKIVSRQIKQGSLDRYIDFKPYGDNESKQIELGFSQDELAGAALTNPEKIYFRFTLIAACGIDSYINSSPQIVSYFGDIPTVSHRAHHIGINNNVFKAEDVLVISNYQNHRFIRLVGVDENGEKSEIKIDLRTGSIEGGSLSNIIIDGGSW